MTVGALFRLPFAGGCATLCNRMHYLTISEYARLAGKTRQAIQGQIRRHKLKLAKRPVSQTFIVLTDEEYESVKAE